MNGANVSGMLWMGWDALLQPLGTDGREIVADFVATEAESTTQNGSRQLTQSFMRMRTN